jgi:hypothetical protein
VEKIEAFPAGLHDVESTARALLQLPVGRNQQADEGAVHVGALREIDVDSGNIRGFFQAREQGFAERVAERRSDSSARRDEPSPVVLSDEDRVR